MLASGNICIPGDAEKIMQNIDCDGEGLITFETLNKAGGGRLSLRTETDMLGNIERSDEKGRPKPRPKVIKKPLSM